MAFIGALQFHDLYQPFQFEALREGERLAITSLAGNAGDLGAFLVLPALVAQRRLARGEGGPATWLALALAFYGLVITQTLAAGAALAVGVLVFWSLALPARRRYLALGSAAGAVVLALAISSAARERAVVKFGELARGEWNELLTGRLDGWRTGLYMLRENPLTGVGFGAYRTEFLDGKEALTDRGVRFFEQQFNPVFANAHNEPIEVGAELGVAGLAALAWFLFEAIRRVRGLTRPGDDTGAMGRAAIDRGFAWASLAALLVLSLFHFPFRIAIVASGALLFFAWLFAAEEEEA
jgi:O-antigen ligase